MSRQLLEIAGVLGLAMCVVASGIWIVGVEHRSRRLEGLERLVPIRGARKLDQVCSACGGVRVEQPGDAIQPVRTSSGMRGGVTICSESMPTSVVTTGRPIA